MGSASNTSGSSNTAVNSFNPSPELGGKGSAGNNQPFADYCGHCNDKGGLIMMDSVWDVLGIALANTESENKYAAYALGALAIVASKGRATDDVLKAELAAEKGIFSAKMC